MKLCHAASSSSYLLCLSFQQPLRFPIKMPSFVTCSNAGEARTLLGRRRGSLRSFREALNHPIQGTAADGQKLALALLWERRNECPHAFPILVVHDEIVIECDEDKVEEAREWLMSAMVDGMNAVVNASEPPVPIEIEAAISDSWIK